MHTTSSLTPLHQILSGFAILGVLACPLVADGSLRAIRVPSELLTRLEQAGADGQDAILPVLREVPEDLDEAGRTQAARALSEVEGLAAPLIDALACGVIPGVDGSATESALTHTQLEVLHAALRLLPSEEVLTVLDGRSDAVQSTDWNLVALELLAERGDARHVDLLLRIVLGPDGSGTVSPQLETRLDEALSGILARDPEALAALRWLPDSATPIRRAVLRAVGRSTDPRGLHLLLSHVEHEPAALLEIGRLAPHADKVIAQEIAPTVRRVLRSGEAREQRYAMRALAALEDSRSIPALLLALRSEDSASRRTAHGALQDLTGARLPLDPKSWNAWYHEERRWIREEAHAVLEGLRSGEDAAVVEAIRELSARGIFRAEIAETVGRLVRGHPSPVVRAQGCLALGRLAVRCVRGPLLDATADEDGSVRARAHSALEALELRPAHAHAVSPKAPR